MPKSLKNDREKIQKDLKNGTSVEPKSVPEIIKNQCQNK